MRQEKLEYLQKKYESRLNPGKEDILAGPKGGMPKGPGHGKGNMAGGKPKNIKKTVGRLLGYISNEKWKLAVVCLCVVGGTVASLAGSYMLRPIINGLTSESGSTASLLRGVLAMAVIYLLGVLAQYLQQRIMIGISQNAIVKLRNDLFGKLQNLPVRYYDTNNHG
ncbi:MAG: ABC transporter ATP-binding protein, partial [Lachnospiraceae bacterium]|nr:ABC transporter ATP-binding protein [Lachnospiraceae bacterium]